MQSPLASLLLIVILIDYNNGNSETKEKLPKPDISIGKGEGDFSIACVTGVEDLTAARNITCSLYTGSNRVLYTRTWTKKTTCYFAVTLIDLQRAQQSERPLVSCDYRVNTDPHTLSPKSQLRTIPGKLPKPTLLLTPDIIPVWDSVSLRCEEVPSSSEDQCIFTINGVESSDSPCQRQIRGADLLSGRSHSARTDIKITCVRSAMKFRESDPSVVTVLDLMKPSISVSTEHTDTLIHCEAPSVITGAHFHLYNNRSSAHIKETQAGEQDRAVTFTVPNNSDSTLIYCCRYQYKSINSELSDCIEAVEPTGESTDWPMIVGIVLPVLILLGVTVAFLFWKCKKSGSNRLPVSPTTGTEKAACEVPNEGASSDPTTTSDLMYITVSHLPSHPSAFQPQEESVVYSSLKTN